MKNKRKQSPVDKKIAAVEGNNRHLIELAQEAVSRGECPDGVPEVEQSYKALIAATNRLIPFIADGDLETRKKAVLSVQTLGRLGQDRMIATMRRTKDPTLRIVLIKCLAALCDGNHPGVIKAFVEVQGKYFDPELRRAFHEAFPVLMKNWNAHRRSRMAAEQACEEPAQPEVAYLERALELPASR